jgi:hypothetical protein
MNAHPLERHAAVTEGDIMATTVSSARHEIQPRHQSRRIWRSVGAVFAGFLVIAVLDNGFDFILHSTGVYPPLGQTMADSLFLLALTYRTLDGILGTYVAGRLAPRRPLAHALTLGGIGVLLGSLGVLATLNGGPEFGPIWYPLALVAITVPSALIGGRLAEAHRR